MSYSQSTVARAVQRWPSGPERALATVMCLPLLDGLFPTLVLAGALGSPVGVAEVGLLVFGGSATVAIVLAEMDGTRAERVRSILLVGAVVVPVAALETALAPTLQSVVNLSTLEPFAALVVLTVAARTASASVADWLPRPAVVVALGVLVSLDPAGASLALSPDWALVARGGAAAGIGVALALGVALAAPWLHAAVDVDRFRFGSAVALGVLAFSLVGLVPSNSPLALAVLAVTALLSLDPSSEESGVDDMSVRERAWAHLPARWRQWLLVQSPVHDDPTDEPQSRFPTEEWSTDGDRPPWL